MSGKRVFRKERANISVKTHRHSFRFSDLHLIKGRGVARKPLLGDPAVQIPVLINSFRGSGFQRSSRYLSMLETKHARPRMLDSSDTALEGHLVRQMLLSQGPLTAERTYAAILALDGEAELPHRTLERLERLRIERYVFRLTMKRWRKLCSAAGHADGSEISFDKRPIADTDFVYVPREVYLPIEETAKYAVKRRDVSTKASLYQPGLQPSLSPSATARTALPMMGRDPSRRELAAIRADYLQDMRDRWARLTSYPGWFKKGYPRQERYSLVGAMAVAARQRAIEAREKTARSYGKEPYAEEDIYEQYTELPVSPEASATAA